MQIESVCQTVCVISVVVVISRHSSSVQLALFSAYGQGLLYSGVQQWPDGSRYEGEFKDDSRHGTGQHVWSTGEVS